MLQRSPELAEQVRSCLAGLAPEAEVDAHERIGSLEPVMLDGACDVLVAGPSLISAGGLPRLAALHEQAPSVSIILALAERPDARLAEIVRVGAIDLVALPCDDSVLRASLGRALDIARRRRAPSRGRGADAGRVITITSASGGSGKTFVATNTALFLARETGKRVVLVDLDLQFGEVSTALRLRPGFSIVDALRGDDEGADLADHLGEFLVEHPQGFSVLAAPRDPVEGEVVTPADVTRVLDVLRSQADYVIVDTPEALGDHVVAALDASDHVLTLATLDVPSLRNAGVFLESVERLGVPAERVTVIVNKAEEGNGLAVDHAAAEFPRGFQAVLPYERGVSRSVNLGVPLLASDPRSRVARSLRQALETLLSETLQPGRPRVPEPADEDGWAEMPTGEPSTSLPEPSASPARPGRPCVVSGARRPDRRRAPHRPIHRPAAPRTASRPLPHPARPLGGRGGRAPAQERAPPELGGSRRGG